MWGDTNQDGEINVYDMFCVLDGFAGDFTTCTFQGVNLMPCAPDGLINVFDLLAVVNAWGGEPFPCAIPCGGACCGVPAGERCLMLTTEECIAQGGEPQGEGTICDPNACAP